MVRILSCLLALSCVQSEPGTPAAPSAGDTRRPNVIVVTLDTTRRDALSVYGADPTVSPALTALAQHGARFDRAYTVTPLTIPAHSSLFTGLYPPRHGVRDNGDFFLSTEVTTLAEHLKAAGYRTMAAVGAEVTSHHWGFSQGFDAYFDDMGSSRSEERNRWRVERPGNLVADDALQWLGQQEISEDPLFVWMHLFDAHHPYEAPPETAQLFPGEPYAAEVAFADIQLQRLVSAIQRHDAQLQNTWFFVLADHGESHGAHGESLHGTLLYDETMAIPLVVRPPRGLPGMRIVQAPVSIVDVMPTVLLAAGLSLPTPLDGQPLQPWLSGEAPLDTRRAVYMESLYGWHHYGWAPLRALAVVDSKLIDSPEPEVYRREDSAERANLATTEPALAARLLEEMDGLAVTLVPLEDAASAASLSTEQTAQLEALGYVMTEQAAAGAVPWRDRALPNPVDKLPSLRRSEDVRRALQEGDLSKARTLAEALLRDEPTLVDPARTLASILVRQGELDSAEALLAGLEARQPSTQNKLALANLQLQRRNLDAARTLFSAALETDTYLTPAWAGFLHALWISGDLEALGPALDDARTKVPTLPIVSGLSGVLLSMKGRCLEADAVLREALSLDDRQPFVHHALAMCRRSAGDAAAAEEALLEEVRLHTPALPSRRVLVEMYAGQKRYEDQLAQLQEIASHEPPHPLTAHSQAQALYNLKRFNESREAVDRCLALAPTYPACVMLLANVLHRQGEEDEAQKVYREALALVNQEPPPVASEAAKQDRYWQE